MRMNSDRLSIAALRRTLLMLCVALGAGSGACYAQSNGLERPVTVDIAPQKVSTALLQLSHQASVQVLMPGLVGDRQDTQGVRGKMSLQQAITKLLEGTTLRFHLVGEDIIGIEADSAPARSSAVQPALRLTQSVVGGSAQTAPAQDTSSTSDGHGSSIQEVVVTAQKRSERVRDVPVPVTAIRAEALVDSNQLRLQDYYSRIPGVTLTVGDGRGMPMISIRGITSGYTNPTVGVVVDDAPYGASTNFALGAMVPDLDPSELARVEVLRGPQGTLYGASSMGGLLNYVTMEPSLERLNGRVQAGLSSVYNGDEPGYNVSAAVNVPLSETFAIRANGFTRRDAGYIDDPVRGKDGINQATYEGGRIAALWRPTENVSLKVSGLLQKSRTDGLSRVDLLPGLEDLEQTTLPGTGWLDKDVAAYTANLTARLGKATLTAISGYNVNTFYDAYDLTPIFAAFSEALFGVTGSPLYDYIRTTKITEELRLSMPIGQRFDWLVGAFYTDEDNELEQQLLAVDPTGAVAGSWYDGDNPSTFAEFAVFTNLTIHLTDRFDVQIGGRETRIRQTTSGRSTGPLVGGESVSSTNTRGNAFTYLLTPRLKLSPDLMLYARLASGYRAGLPNGTLLADVPPASAPDKTKNYELGIKGAALGGALSFDLSLYHIDWTGIQLQVINSRGTGYFTNGSEARSRGLELSVESRPARGLTVAGWVSWGEAELTEDFPAGSTSQGFAGDRLPYSTRLSGYFSVEKEFPLTTSVMGFAGAAVSYVGDRVGYFRGAPQRQVLPSYTKTDLRAGVRFDAWTVNLFVNNLTDQRGLLTGGLDATPVVGFTYIQPRTVGLNASYNW